MVAKKVGGYNEFICCNVDPFKGCSVEPKYFTRQMQNAVTWPWPDKDMYKNCINIKKDFYQEHQDQVRVITGVSHLTST